MGRQEAGGPGNDRLGPQAGLLAEPPGQLPERLGSGCSTKGRGRSAHTTRRDSARLSRADRRASLDVPLHRAPEGQGLLGRLQQQHHTGKALGQGVVEVAGQPLALSQRPGLAFGAASSARVACSCSISRWRSRLWRTMVPM